MTSSGTSGTKLTPSICPDTSFKIIGLGGVGNIIARYLSVFLSYLAVPCRLVCIDGDNFEPKNAERMLFARCGNKAGVVVDEMKERFGAGTLSLLALSEYVVTENIARLIQPNDIVLLAVDNHATRALVSQHCGTLSDVVLISGGNDGVENGQQGTYGNCQVYVRKGGKDATPSLLKYHPEIETPADKLPTDKSCIELLESVPQILFTNLTTAAAMLNTLWLHLCGALEYPELCFEISKGLMRPVML